MAIINQTPTSTTLIAIDGYGGSGKTTLADELAKILHAEVIHTDDFASFDNPMDWWPRMLKDVIQPVMQGVQYLSYKRGSWYKNHNPSPVIDQPVTPILILEGVSASRKEFRQYIAYSVWVETPIEECIARGIERDLSNNESGKTDAEIRNDWEKWHTYEKEYVMRDNPQEYADYIYNGS